MDKHGLGRQLSKIFHGIFGVIWMGILPGVALVMLYFDGAYIFVGAACVITAFILFYRNRMSCGIDLYKHIERWIEKHKLVSIVCVLLAIQVLLQLWIGYELEVWPSSDRKIIFEQASWMAKNGIWHTSAQYNHYFLRYPNNVAMLLLETGVFRIIKMLGIRDFLYGNIVFNILCIDTAIVLCIVLAYRKYGKKAAVGMQILCMFFVPFYTYVPFVYTDTIVLPVTAGLLLCYDGIEESFTKHRTIRTFVLATIMGILTWIGFELKPTVAIVTVACMMHLVMTRFGKRAIMAVMCVLFVCGNGMRTYKNVLTEANVVDQTDYDKENFPYTHWLMMGLQGFGNYSHADRVYTSSFETKAEKQKANLAMIKKRLKSYGITGVVGHQYVKLVSTWFNGKYDMNIHLNRKPVRKSVLRNMLSYNDGMLYHWYSTYCSFYQFFLLGAVLISLRQGYKKQQMDSSLAWKLAVFGLGLFLSVWETKSRYVMHMMPVLMLIALDVILKNKCLAVEYVKSKCRVQRGTSTAYLLSKGQKKQKV